ncbi:hypothetical protein Tco_0681792 [Tanacetum coccineum]|uniref:Uncharacterized protein n=1 Tax=Tanacetum coccineum TaxID=301880 RepID=A0ABQ4XPC5_9ASTR
MTFSSCYSPELVWVVTHYGIRAQAPPTCWDKYIQEIRFYEEHEYELNNNMTRDLKEPCADINGLCNGGELPGMVRVRCMTYFQDHKWYDELADGVLKEEALIYKARFEESWEDATPRVMKFCAWNYGENNVGDTQDSQEHKKEHEGNEHTLSFKPTHDLSVCHVRRFEMIKYSFDADDEYVAIKEHECFDHSRTNIDACQAYSESFSHYRLKVGCDQRTRTE